MNVPPYSSAAPSYAIFLPYSDDILPLIKRVLELFNENCAKGKPMPAILLGEKTTQEFVITSMIKIVKQGLGFNITVQKPTSLPELPPLPPTSTPQVPQRERSRSLPTPTMMRQYDHEKLINQNKEVS